MEKMSLKEKKIAQARVNFVRDISSLKDIGYYDGFIHYHNNPERGINTIYELIAFMLEQDKEFKKKYESAVKSILDFTDVENQRYYEYSNLYNIEDEKFQYDSEKIKSNFSHYLFHEEWDSPGFSAREAVLRHLKYYGAHNSDVDHLMDYLLRLLRDAREMFENNKWAVKLSEIEQLQEKLISEQFEEKEETKRCLASKYMEIITALYNGEEIMDDKYYPEHIISNLIHDCGSVAYEIIKNSDDKAKVNGITLKQFIISKGIQSLLDSFGRRQDNTEKVYASICDDKETGRYEVIKSLIVGKNSSIPEEIFETIDEETFKRIINEIEINDSNIEYLVYTTPKISIECVRAFLKKVKANDYNKLYSEILSWSKNYPEIGIMYIELLPEIESSTDEYSNFSKELLEKTFISTFDNSYKRKELEIIHLMAIFSSHKDLKELKEYIYNTILLDERCNTSAEYITKIVYAYWSVYCQITNEEVDIKDFASEFMSNLDEKRQIKAIQKSTRGIFNYTGSDMYEKVYEDEKVKISYLDGINGLFVEEKGYEYNKERYYLYPAINEESETFIAKRSGVAPKDLLEELTNKENDTAFNFMSFRTDHYTKYMPNEEVSDKGWPTFAKESYINLTGDDSLSDDEAFDKTCEIIKSNPVLKKLIKISQKTYKKKSNN